MDEVRIDVDYLLQIAGEDKELVMDIINDFEVESMELITKLGDVADVEGEGSLLEIRKILHKFKGGASSLGMVSLSEVLVELESFDLEYWSSGKVDVLAMSEHLAQSVAFCQRSLS